ncbi:extracellular solute-binding protein [Candidatus Uabimicrobium sp. HlEnr_7]|uniref:extracellular solute-binding protein n=1 Tax=Candidatus Uabimicrobium helgolandensis TaxID=3095367 RepID=UPI0035573BD6
MYKLIQILCFALCLVASVHAQEPVEIIFSQGKTLGAQREALFQLFKDFEKENPNIRVSVRELPNATDKQHQYYLTSLGGGARDIDLMVIDVIWVSEFAHANWLAPFHLTKEEKSKFLPATIKSCTYKDKMVALPWYIDAGLMYYRADLLKKYDIPIPKTWTWQQMQQAYEKIVPEEKKANPNSPLEYGFICQGRHYEGLVCAFLEILRGCGGEVVRDGKVVINDEKGLAALQKIHDLIHKQKIIPTVINNFDEEESRMRFLNGKSLFLRNWPYVWSFVENPNFNLKGKIGVSPSPHLVNEKPSATLGGWQLAVSSYSRYPKEAAKLARFLASARAQKQLALYLSRNPTLLGLYNDKDVLQKNPFFRSLKPVFLQAEPRPVTHLYPQISHVLQREISLLITNQKTPQQVANDAAQEIDAIFHPKAKSTQDFAIPVFYTMAGLFSFILLLMVFKGSFKENITALTYLAPAMIIIFFVAILPLLYALFLSFYQVEIANIMHPQRWMASGLDNFARIFSDPHFTHALINTLAITIVAVTLQLILGIIIAVTLSRSFLGRGPIRALILLPWILPTIVAGKMWLWIFATEGGIANYFLMSLGWDKINWIDPGPAFVSIIIAEVWKTTPFMAILLLAGLTNISKDLYKSAKVDGASSWYTFVHITLPLLRPAILLALLFRTMDSLRIFDVVYAMTAYAESTKTLSIYIHEKIGAGDLSYASALSLVTFAIIFAISLVYLSLLGKKMESSQ